MKTFSLIIAIVLSACVASAQTLEPVTGDNEVSSIEDIVINKIDLVTRGELVTLKSIDAKINYVSEEITRLENTIDELTALRALVEIEAGKVQLKSE